MKTKTKKTAANKRAQRKGESIPIRCSFDEMRDVAAIVPHPRNPNKHPEGQLELFARILQHQGIRRPIVISKRSGFVVSGHGLLQAAIKAGVPQLPVDIQEFKNEADEWAHLIADNRLAELSSIDNTDLAKLIGELDGKLDLTLTGFSKATLKNILNQWGDKSPASVEIPDAYQIVIDCEDEGQQVKLLARFQKEGITCRALTS